MRISLALLLHPLLAICAGLSVVSIAFADGPMVRLDAPANVRPLLLRYVDLFGASSTGLPLDDADRIALMRRTRKEISDLLATEGYFSPKVRLDRSDPAHPFLTVQTGEQAKVSEVVIRFEGALGNDAGDNAKRRDALRRDWALPVGQAFRQADWDKAKEALLAGVASEDFAAATLGSTRAEVDPEQGTVRLSISVDSGPRFTFGPLEVEGLETYPKSLVSGLNSIQPGQPYTRDALLHLQSVLQNTPYFASVNVDVDRDRSHPERVPVQVLVTEARPKRLSFGAGYSSNNGARGEVMFRDNNVIDGGWQLVSGARIEQRHKLIYSDLFRPLVADGYQDSFGAQYEGSDNQGLKIINRAVGAARSFGGGSLENRVAVKLQHETREPNGAASSQLSALTLNWSMTWRDVDSILDPRKGFVVSTEIGGASRVLLSDRNFVRFYGRATRYQPVGRSDVIILRGEGGITVAKSRDSIPQDFLFRAGGAQSVRGYAYQSLGVQEGDATVGGRYLATLSGEYVHWLKSDWGVATFLDAGNASDDRPGFRLFYGYGVGARWRSPAGPLALDLAYGQHDHRVRLHFSIAIAF